MEENYKIIWKNEVIDYAETISEAIYLKNEYNLAYGGGVSVKEINN